MTGPRSLRPEPTFKLAPARQRTLRTRLALTFFLVVLIPLLAVAVLVIALLPRQLSNQARTNAVTSLRAVSSTLAAQCAMAGEATAIVANDADDLVAAQASLIDQVARHEVTAGIVTDAGGAVVAKAGTVPAAGSQGGATGQDPAVLTTATDCGTDLVSRLGLTAVVGLPSGGKVVTLRALDVSTLAELATGSANGTTVLLTDGRAVLAYATATSQGALAPSNVPVDVVQDAISRDVTQAVVEGNAVVSVGGTSPTSGEVTVVVPLRNADPLYIGLVAVIAFVAVVAAAIGLQLARAITRPLVRLSDAAARIAGGDVEAPIEVDRTGDEIERLGQAFGDMTHELRQNISRLEANRDELRQSLGRLGDTLSSTHDLGRILSVVLETAVAAAEAEAGVVLQLAGGRDELFVKAQHALEGRLPEGGAHRISVGDGVSGRVAATGQSLRGEVGTGPGQLMLAPDEPQARTLISVPLRSSNRITGVLNLYDKVGGGAFSAEDLDMIRTFASQAAVAVDNVLLHQEAQRLSITDGLTGLWNYRYFTMALTREVERAARFNRPMSLLMLDLDRFKLVNDTYGHQRGDSVLIEVAARVRGAIREVDVLARYGGEELVLLLPETDAAGAAVIAERVCEAVRKEPFGVVGEEPVAVTISVGAAVHPANGANGAALVRAADEALYVAKDTGRDRWALAGTAPVA